MHAQGGLERVTLKMLGVQRQKLVVNAELERQKLRAKELRVQLEQLLEHGLDGGRCRLFRSRGNHGAGVCDVGSVGGWVDVCGRAGHGFGSGKSALIVVADSSLNFTILIVANILYFTRARGEKYQ